MGLHVLAQCMARLLLALQQKQKQGRQRAGIGSRDSEEQGRRSDWGVFWALADLGMEEQVKRGWCVYVCVLHAFRYRLIDCSFSQLSRLYGVEPDRATWQAAHIAFTQALVAPPETVQQKELSKLL